MVRAVGPRRGQIDEFTAAVRRGYVTERDDYVMNRSPWLREAMHWSDTPETEESRAHRAEQQARVEHTWAVERALWEAGETFILSTTEMFFALSAISDARWRRFVFATDRPETRRWQVPGTIDGGTVLEVEWRADDDDPETGDWYLAGTDMRAPGAA